MSPLVNAATPANQPNQTQTVPAVPTGQAVPSIAPAPATVARNGTSQKPPNVISVHVANLLQSWKASRFSGTGKHLALNIISLGLLVIVVIFVQATYSAEYRSNHGLSLNQLLRISESTTIAVVQTSQTILIAFITVTLGEAFEFIYWIAAGSGGLRYLTFLAISPTTGYKGTLQIVFARPFSCIPLAARLWGLVKVLLTGGIWLSGIVLFINTSSISVYDTGLSYDVTAGIGPFTGSLVQPFIDLLQTRAETKSQTLVPYTFAHLVNLLVTNPAISTVSSPVSCTDDGKGGCTSYLVTGGLESVTPWITPAQYYSDFTMARLDRVPSIQVDVSTLDAPKTGFSDKDCEIFGKYGIIIGLKLCIAADPTRQGSLRAGLFVCTDGTNNNRCHHKRSESFLPNITAQITFYTSHATLIASRSNYSIVSIIDQTPPIPYLGFHTHTHNNANNTNSTSTPPTQEDQNLQSYRSSLHWLLDFSASDIPAPSSIAELFWTASLQLSDPSTSIGIVSQNFHSLLVFPFFIFNINNWGNLQTKTNETVPGLPGEFYTTASLVQGYEKVMFDRGMFVLFLVLQGVAAVFVWGVLGWVWFGGGGGQGGGKGRLPEISEFPLYDGLFRTRVVDGRGGGNSAGVTLSAGAGAGAGTSTREIIRDTRGYTVILR
ncbi:hypothetical protein QBC37DRAFT_274751 [Rhypophila decipiens]|uniref:Uncharacterized protein n=1 Tax=Rhypophila decipiens TaxID=261697 RepID=A0AAN6YH15_9PEZI|nr:hypothetical protein QBC37DRAFT_274751 [Rhypophila decipiens]